MKELHHITNIFAKARQKEFIEHLCYYQLLYIFSGDGFQIPCLRKYERRYRQALTNVRTKTRRHILTHKLFIFTNQKRLFDNYAGKPN